MWVEDLDWSISHCYIIFEGAEHLANDPKVEKDNIDQVRLGDCGQEEKLCLINKDVEILFDGAWAMNWRVVYGWFSVN